MKRSDTIRDWPGGEIRVYARQRLLRTRKGKQELYLHTKPLDPPTAEAVPFGNGLALMLDPGEKHATMSLPSGLMLDVEVRAGRPECVAIRSGPHGPPVTTTRLRISVEKELKYLVEHLTVRLEVDRKGEIIGVLATSPYSLADPTPVSRRTADVRQRLDETAPKRGRPRLSDEHLREVVAEYEDAKANRASAAAAIAKRWHVQPATARQWVYKARRRGLFNDRQEEHDG